MANTAHFETVSSRFIRNCKSRKFSFKAGDLSGTTLTSANVLMQTLVLRRLLNREFERDAYPVFGILIPPSVGGLLVNLACAIDRRIPVNLNYTHPKEILNHCIGQAGIRKVLTSRRVTGRLGFVPDVDLVLLEDLIEQVTWRDKFVAAFDSYIKPADTLISELKLGEVDPDDLQTIIFTSGTTGMPKGVMLSQRNISSNIDAIGNLIRLDHGDTIAGILPFFHSFGYTMTLWAPMLLDAGVAYHFSPLAARQVGRLVRKFRATLLLATPTFLRNYLRRVTAEEFESLRVVVSGAERLAEELQNDFQDKFGVTVVEGYGTTELSPIVSGNVPTKLSGDPSCLGDRPNSVGRVGLDMEARITDVETGEKLPAGESGILWIRGPNVMLGYLNNPELTSEVMNHGWYNTGDIAEIDSDGFIFIKGRQRRFSKIGGEMVSQPLIEEKLLQLMSSMGNKVSDEQVAVTSVTDSKKGEKLVVLHQQIDQTAEELVKGLQQLGLPSLFIPQESNFFEVATIPMTGSGKKDLGEIRRIAEQLAKRAALETPEQQTKKA